MYLASDKFNAAILGDDRKFHTKLAFGNTEVTDVVRSIKQYSQVVQGNVFSIGGAVSSYIDIELWNPDFQIEGNEFDVYIGLETDSKNIEWCPIGKFTAERPKTSIDGLITVTAYDRIQSKMSGAYFSDLTYPTDAKNVLNEISVKTGVAINTSNLESGVVINKVEISSEDAVDSDGNKTTETKYGNPFDGYTYREALGYIAMLYCKYAVSDRDGSIKFVWFSDSNYTLEPNKYYDDYTTAEVVFKVGTIVCSSTREEFRVGSGAENVRLDNPLMTQDRLNYIYNQVKDLQFIPMNLSFLGDIRVDLGDVVTVEKNDGTFYKIPVMNMSHDFDGGLKTFIESYGGSEQENTNKGPTITKLERQYVELFLVKELVGKKANFDYVFALDGEFKTLKADYAEFQNATVLGLQATNAEIENIKSTNITTENLNAALAAIEVLTVGTADLKYATIQNLSVLEGSFDALLAKAITVENLSANVADLGYATIDELESKYAKIETLETNYLQIKDLSAETAKLGYATIGQLEATEGRFEQLTAGLLDIRLSNIDTANIDKAVIATMFVELGLIDTAVIENGHITGYLDSVSINANAIKAGTLSVDRLVINGTNESLIFALNNAGNLTSTSVNTLDGGLLTDRTITADKIVAHSITANEITTSNIAGSSGWINLAEGTFNYGNQLTWDGSNLVIKTNSIQTTAGKKYATEEDVDDIKIGARNLIRNSQTLKFSKYYFDDGTIQNITSEHDELGNVTLIYANLNAVHDNQGNVILYGINSYYDGIGNVILF